MKLKILLFVICILCASTLVAQQVPQSDSTKVLDDVIVKAYASDRPQSEVPAAIAVIKDSDLNRFSNVSLLPAANSVPGVRMEERSPGSYRFSIRGSTLRSPFGVRNVKFYWNGLPMTDGSGNTYLNLFDFNSIGSMEIIKGPGASLYGAGTGGVVLLQAPAKSPFTVQYVAGSYGLSKIQGGGTLLSSKKFQLDLRLGSQHADGYRQQTKMDRQTAQLDWQLSLSPKSFLSGTTFSTDLYYQTPGGLTQTQYEQDARQARPDSSPTSPGAVKQQASVTNRTGYAGLSFDHQWSDQWSTRIGMFGSITHFTNPSIRNYEIREEENWGGRTDTQYKFDKAPWKGKFTVGAEYQHFFSPVTDYDNLSGIQGNVQTDDVLRSQLFLGFVQGEFDLPKNFYLTIGGSANYVNYSFLRKAPAPQTSQDRNFDPVVLPRIALLKKISSMLSVYGSVSSGFSPPSLAEVRPSTATFNNTLNAEHGTSYEAGAKGRLFNAVDFSVAFYDFRLKDAIVIQRDATGADYFVNAGSTSQQGSEIYLSWLTALSNDNGNSLRLWTSYTYNHYRFDQYVNDGKNYSGNALTGVSPTLVTFGGDLIFRKGLYLNFTGNYSERLPLNDANTDYAADYFLLGSRIGYKATLGVPVEFFVGIDNALDHKYSLGNDLNAAGGRYYNVATGRNYYAGIIVKLAVAPLN